MRNLDRHIDEWITREVLSCDGTATCMCPDCCADAAQAEYEAYVRRERS